MVALGPVSVVKIGGSLLADAARLRAVLLALADGEEGRVVIVPGGGPFADAVRAAQVALGFPDALAHRLALDAMGAMAEVFLEIEPRLVLVRSIEAAATHEGSCLWDPAALRAGHPDISERWDVTSDSLALWLAARLGATRCVLLKSALCPAGAPPEELVRLGIVDRAFPGFARAFAGEIVLRGPDTSSRLHPHPGLPAWSGSLQRSRGLPEPSFEVRLHLAPQDEGDGGMAHPASSKIAAA